MLDIDLVGFELVAKEISRLQIERLSARALAERGVNDGHLGVEFVDAERIRLLNRDYRGKDSTTDVLSFPVDGIGQIDGPRELGDIVIYPEQTEDLIEAVLHGVLHLLEMDHETDNGEMLALQDRLLQELRDEWSAEC